MPKNILVSIYFLTVNNGNTKRISEICSKLTDVRTKLTNRFHLLLWCFQYWLWTSWLCRLWSLIWRQCVSEGKKCSFFGKPGVLCFLETPVLRFALCLITNNFLINKSMAFVTQMVLIVNLDFIVFRIKLRVSWGIELHLHKILFKEMRATFRWIVSG